MEALSLMQRDIVLVPFPFSDQSGQKVRPALVLSNKGYNQAGNDVIVCAITSNLQPKHSIIFGQENLDMGVLHQKSAIKADSIIKLHKSLVLKQIGSVNRPTFARVVGIIKQLLAE